jgi:CheY-like chemotaxis protein
MVPTNAAESTASTAPPSVTGLRITGPSWHQRPREGEPTRRRDNGQTGKVSDVTSRPQLLIIDDGPDMVRLLEAITAATWEVRTAANMAEAVEVASAHPVDVAVVDFMLPGGGGFSVARRLKKLKPDCTIVMFSAAPVGHQAADSPDVDEFVMKGDVPVIRRLLDDLAGRMQPGGS